MELKFFSFPNEAPAGYRQRALASGPRSHEGASAVSQRVKQLEERLGVMLIGRGAPCVATERGEWLCRDIEHVGLLETELMRKLPELSEAGEPAPRVTLNIAVRK